MGKLLLCLACIGMASGCGGTKAVLTNGKEAKNPGYQKISAKEAHSMMSELEDFILLDVRTNDEYKERHIEGAVLIPVQELGTRAETELPDKLKVIFVYCRSGRRSADAARQLVKMDYKNVYDFGGINDWPY